MRLLHAALQVSLESEIEVKLHVGGMIIPSFMSSGQNVPVDEVWVGGARPSGKLEPARGGSAGSD